MKTPIIHGLVTAVLFALPVIIASHSPLLDLSVGGILTAIYHGILAWSTATPAATTTQQ